MASKESAERAAKLLQGWINSARKEETEKGNKGTASFKALHALLAEELDAVNAPAPKVPPFPIIAEDLEKIGRKMIELAGALRGGDKSAPPASVNEDLDAVEGPLV